MNETLHGHVLTPSASIHGGCLVLQVMISSVVCSLSSPSVLTDASRVIREEEQIQDCSLPGPLSADNQTRLTSSHIEDSC